MLYSSCTEASSSPITAFRSATFSCSRSLRRPLVVSANGQLGRAVAARWQGRAEGAGVIAPRLRSSVLDLAKIEANGFVVRDQAEALAAHLGVVAR